MFPSRTECPCYGHPTESQKHFTCVGPASETPSSLPRGGSASRREGGGPYPSETLLQVVRQEAVEDGVGAGVGVGQDDGEEVDAGSGARLWDDDHQVDDVDDEEGQPAEHKHHHDHHHHPGHLALRAPTLGESGTSPGGLHLQGAADQKQPQNKTKQSIHLNFMIISPRFAHMLSSK